MAVSGLRDLLGREALRVRAGDRTFRRGERYTAEGRVSGIGAAYEDRPTLEGFLLLKSHAQRIDTWPAWRARAIDTAREAVVRAQATARPARSRWDLPVDGSALARMYLSEGNVDAAWQEAMALGCSEQVWRELARRREGVNPDGELRFAVRALRGGGQAASARKLITHVRTTRCYTQAGT